MLITAYCVGDAVARNIYKYATIGLLVMAGWFIFDMVVPSWWWVPPTNNQPHDLEGFPEAWSVAITESLGSVALYATSQNDCLITVTKEGNRLTFTNTTLVAKCGVEIPRMVGDGENLHRVDPTDFEFSKEFNRCHYSVEYDEWPDGEGSISLTHRCYWP